MQEGSHGLCVSLVGYGKRVVELGPATGYMSRAMTDNHCTVFGIEIDEEAAEQAREHCANVFVRDLDRLEDQARLPLWGADVIVAADVLEHLTDPVRCLRYVKRWLTPGGYVVASVPNVAHGSVRLALLAGHWDYQEHGLLDRTHLRWFTLDTLVPLFGDAGYAIEGIWRIDIPIEISEVPWPREDPWFVKLAGVLAEDPDALTYQYVVKTRPV